MHCLFPCCNRKRYKKPVQELPDIQIHPPPSSITPSYQPPSILPGGTQDSAEVESSHAPSVHQPIVIPNAISTPVNDGRQNDVGKENSEGKGLETVNEEFEKSNNALQERNNETKETNIETEKDNSEIINIQQDPETEKTFKSIDSLNDPFSTASDLLRTWTKQAKEFEELCGMSVEFKGTMEKFEEGDEESNPSKRDTVDIIKEKGESKRTTVEKIEVDGSYSKRETVDS